jgi:lysophospholipid acyltransferase (LPLAT)-like uncharacterized protein
LKKLTFIEKVLMFLVKWAGSHTYRLLYYTFRVRVEGLEQAVPCILNPHIGASWHSRTLSMPWLVTRLPSYGFMVSQSKDGRMVSYMLKGLGQIPIVGSSSRRGLVAALEARKLILDGGRLGMAPDGPRGPSREVQSGVVSIAIETGVPVLPIAVSAKDAWWARSWDRFLFPKPFTQLLYIIGNPLFPPPRGAGDEEREAFARVIGEELDRITEEADRRFDWMRRNPRAARGLPLRKCLQGKKCPM